MYQIRNIQTELKRNIDLKFEIARKLSISTEQIKIIEILKRSIDARKKDRLKYDFTILAQLSGKIKSSIDVTIFKEPLRYIEPRVTLKNINPFIIGSGPAGLFTALELVEKGFQPYIFEQGECVEDRQKSVKLFWETGVLDTDSNIQFGEGGAGTFSDGKLTARNKDFYSCKVLQKFVNFGANPDILFDALPHIGSDELIKIVKNIRIYLIEKGCKFHFGHKLDSIEIKNNKLDNVIINNEKYSPEILILAIGNSSRETFEMLSNIIPLQSKLFAVGIRIEHPQKFINDRFLGEKADISLTGQASYRLTFKTRQRGIYSFCMCPGGYIVNAASEHNSIVLNGMSNRNRDNYFANSAIIVTVDEQDYGKNYFDGINYQKYLEKLFFDKNNPYFAPVQSAESFVKKSFSKQILKSSFKPGTYPSNISEILPAEISKNLIKGLINFDKKFKGFIRNGIILAPETRTSSPIRILRNKETFETPGVENIYPIGEGSGYAGGIVSSASDGIKLANIFFDK